ncbi:nickel-dependent lactate racemase [Streptomyces sp. 4N509B]|uniref:nickel-dependent lactate racemase n=1 Tax=Streptomyces sp. 4N509B TaxID=3457413 RepID=UPI003FD65034
MRVRLAYGTDGLVADLPGPPEYPPGTTIVVTPEERDPVPDPAAALRAALRRPLSGPPLRALVRPGQTVAIAASDVPRPRAHPLMISAILEELEGVVRLPDVTVLLATGAHRGATTDETLGLLGRHLAGSVRVVSHDARDRASLTWLGTHGDGVPVWLNSRWTGADVRITTGIVEPHAHAGFRGGPALVAPGLAGLPTVLTLYDTRRTGHPKARRGITHGNPVHDDIRAIAEATGVDFGLDVVLNRDHDVVGAFGGETLVAHAAATAAARRLSLRPVPGLFDVVLTTGAGHPLDRNLCQSVEGMSTAAGVVKPGGVIICAAACPDGLPQDGFRPGEPSSAASPRAALAAVTGRARRTVVHGAGLAAADLAAVRLEGTDDVAAAVRVALDEAGDGARLCVLPEGPRTIPYVEA